MASVQIQNHRVNYEKIGRGPLVVLLHGWANTWEAWLPIVPLLADHFTLVIPDLPGFGQSEGPSTGWTTDEYSTWLGAFLAAIKKTVGKDIAALIGHSYGGKLASLYTSQKTSLQPSKLVLIDASGIPRSLTTKQKFLSLLAKVTPPWLKGSISSKLKGQVYSTFEADSDYLTENEAHKATLRKILKENLAKKLSFIDIPTLIIWGEKDTDTPINLGRQFHALIPESQFVTYPTGHFPHHEQPTNVAQNIIKFIQHE